FVYLIICLTIIIFVIYKKFDKTSLFIQKKHRIVIYLLTIYTIFVVYTGALVRHTNADLVCSDWPFCTNGSPFAFSQFSFQQWVQMVNRLAAGILFFCTIIFFINFF